MKQRLNYREEGRIMSTENIAPGAAEGAADGFIPVNGAVIIEISEDNMNAYLYITEERDGGIAVSKDDVTSEVMRRNIANSFLETAHELVNFKEYNKKILIGAGHPPKNGVDGKIEYLFETTNDLVPKKGKLGEVDFKDLGLVRNIHQGELIAQIVHPTEGFPGANVYGQPLLPFPGKAPKFTVGKGTEINAEETEIKAAVSGNLIWDKGGFVVDETLVIGENVDVSTGNIDFIGNVLIKENVAENFTVKSKKNVTVNGNVSGATIIADGDIIINLGCVFSDIVAGGDVKLGFCESSKVECGGNFVCQSVIAGQVYCGGSFNATGGRGVVIGGKHTALTGFAANIIGSESYTKTSVTLGNSAVLAEEKLDLSNKIQDLEDRTKKLLQVAEVLQEYKKNNGGQLPADREAMLTTAIRSRFTFQREVKQFQKRISEIDQELNAVVDQYIVVNKHIWPGVTARIGAELLIVDTHMQKIMIGKDGEGQLAFLPFPGSAKTS
jgi:hypothetical protein